MSNRVSQEIINLYDEYTHVPLDRRVFLDRLSKLAGGTAAATAILPLLENNYALAQTIKQDDPRIVGSRVTYKGASGDVRGYLVKPSAGGRRPAILVIHENRGLNPHIEDVTRRAAVDGFLALGVDALSSMGGTPTNEDQARDMFGKIDRDKTVADLVAGVQYLKNHPESNGKVGCVGFCWGGGMVNLVAVNSSDLTAGVVFYGVSPAPADVPKIKARMMMHYAGLDTRINEGVPAYEAALKMAGVRYTLHMYDNVNHAFHNDTAGDRYNEAAAKLAWQRTIAFFKEALA